ncbi:MAG: enoyl-CoA hydratase/isomerase family protein [Alphaproteobacteria bacterium]|nr:MAG: enoyl-CoA hydratase/isomerase family protein [Alphaproteobacteria bacterium]
MTVTLNRPHVKNAMNAAMVDGLIAAFDAAAADDTVRALVLKGAGGCFSAGGDLKGMGMDGRDAIWAGNRRFGEMLEVAQAFPKPLVAVLEGAALGGGFGLACVADVAIAHAGCRFGMPEVTVGLVPAQIAPFVLARIGLTATRRLALTGQMIDGTEAKALGLVHHVEADADGLEARLAATLAGILKAAPGANRATKALLMKLAPGVDAPALDHAADLFADALMGPEGQEGTAAFRERRKASWQEDVQ